MTESEEKSRSTQPMCSLKGLMDNTQRLNILLFGLIGCGKSSLINTLCTDENNRKNDKIMSFARRGECDDIGTVTFKRYPLSQYLSIFDTWGWNPGKNYLGKEFLHMLMGRVEENTHVKSFSGDGSRETEHQVNVDPEREIDVVFFVLDGSKDQEEILKRLEPFVRLAKSKKKMVFYIVSKIDKLVPNERQKFRRIKTLVFQYQQTHEENSQLIFPIMNYTTQTKKNELIRKMKEPIIEHLLEFLGRKETSVDESSTSVNLLFGEKPPKKFHFSLLTSTNPKTKLKHPNIPLLDTRLKNLSRFIIQSSENLFRSAQFGRCVFRVFLVRSLISPFDEILGVSDHLTLAYFEAKLCFESVTERQKFRSIFINAFDDDDIHPEYVFIRNGQEVDNWGPETHFIRLDFKSEEIKPVTCCWREFSLFHVMIENQFQMCKWMKTKRINSSNDEMKIRRLEIENEGLKKDVNHLRTQMRKLERIFGEKISRSRQETKIEMEKMRRHVEERMEEVNRAKKVMIKFNQVIQESQVLSGVMGGQERGTGQGRTGRPVHPTVFGKVIKEVRARQDQDEKRIRELTIHNRTVTTMLQKVQNQINIFKLQLQKRSSPSQRIRRSSEPLSPSQFKSSKSLPFSSSSSSQRYQSNELYSVLHPRGFDDLNEVFEWRIGIQTSPSFFSFEDRKNQRIRILQIGRYFISGFCTVFDGQVFLRKNGNSEPEFIIESSSSSSSSSSSCCFSWVIEFENRNDYFELGCRYRQRAPKKVSSRKEGCMYIKKLG